MFSKSPCIAFVVTTVLAAGMWGYHYGVLIPAQEAEAVQKDIPRGNLSDLYSRWLGARELLLHGRDPYSLQVTAEIQRGVYGRTLEPRNPNDPLDEVRFAYPVYVVFLLAPTVFFQFQTVQRLYVLLGVIMSAAMVALWVRAFRVETDRCTLAAGMVLMLGSYPVVQGLLLQNLTLVVAALIAGAAASVSAGVLWAAGLLLALAMIKPHLTLPVVGWLLLWAGSDLRKRRTLPLSFFTVMACLLIGSELLLPGWFWRWRDGASAYWQYSMTTISVQQRIFGNTLGVLFCLTILGAVLVFCWRVRRHPAESDGFKLALACVIASAPVLFPKWNTYDQVLFLPVVVLGILWRNEYFKLSALGRLIVVISACLLVGPWLVALVLSLTALLSPATAQRASLAVLVPVVLLPISILLDMMLLGEQRMRRSSPATGFFGKAE